MEIKKIIEQKKKMQESLLDYLEDESDAERNFNSFVKIIANQNIKGDKFEFKSLLQIINVIGNHHHRCHNFINKIDRILDHIKEDIPKYFTNSEIFNIFKDNKRILLFLFESKVIKMDEYIFSQITSDEYTTSRYAEYFSPELQPLLTDKLINKYKSQNQNLKNSEFIQKVKKEIPSDFYAKRREGENEDYLCQLIRNDQIEDFVSYSNQANFSLSSEVTESIFETNPLLMTYRRKELIYYAIFFGSLKIIRYMLMNGKKLTTYMWEYAIHSQNAELIKLFEENKIRISYQGYEPILEDSIRCHHNDFTSYFIDNMIDEKKFNENIEKKFNENIYCYSLQFYNYFFFPENLDNRFLFFYLCRFDYYKLVELFLKQGNININATHI
ncbi:hypothetical protein M9Y10_030414 [Tritrichomonas musculus]|uniref:DUF3447 domain-containing protein n=1 Tax=Tritrichomonas musculus TaxID=1915356 RepID=A0ABR2GJ17_9EUKA